MKKFDDLSKGNVLIKYNDVYSIYIIDNAYEDMIDLTSIKVGKSYTEIGDGMIIDRQLWGKSNFTSKLEFLPILSREEEIKIISGIMGKIEWI